MQFKPGRSEPVQHKYPACGHRKGFKSSVLPPRRHASRAVSAAVREETPKNTTEREPRTRAEASWDESFVHVTKAVVSTASQGCHHLNSRVKGK